MTEVTSIVGYTDAAGSYVLFANLSDGSETVVWDGKGRRFLCEALSDWDRSGTPCFWGGSPLLNPFPGVLPQEELEK